MLSMTRSSADCALSAAQLLCCAALSIRRPSCVSLPQRSLHRSSAAHSAGLVVHRPSADNSPDAKWEFAASNQDKIKEIMAKFPTNYKASAVMPLLVRRERRRRRDGTALLALLLLALHTLAVLLAHSSLHWLRLAMLILPQTLAQEQNDNWLPLAAMNKIAEVRGLARAGVWECGRCDCVEALSADAGCAWRIERCATLFSQLTLDSARAADAECPT